MPKRPRLLVSKCLLGEKCRYDGLLVQDVFVRKLLPHCELYAVCPECEMGLPVPRPKVKMVETPAGKRLVIEDAGIDMTNQIEHVSARVFGALGEINGVVLKSRSPSCGLYDAKVYHEGDFEHPIGRDIGFFAREVLMQYPHLPVESDETLLDPQTRHQFLINIFSGESYPPELLHYPEDTD